MTYIQQVLAIVGAVVTIVGGIIAAIIRIRKYGDVGRRQEERRHSQDRRRIDDVVARLAEDVHSQWTQEEDRRRIHFPFVLPVSWHNAPQNIADQWNTVLGLPSGAAATSVDLAGRLNGIVETHHRLPRRRLVVLGRAGAGKTVLALRFALGLLEQRSGPEPVPVIFGLASWDPTTSSLAHWLTHKLVEEYPYLAARLNTGATLAASLVDSGKIFPVLDGFDEIAEDLRGAALVALNHTRSALLLTSRMAEYVDAVSRTDVLRGAAVVELDDLSVDEVADYLKRAATVRVDATGRASTKWDLVFDFVDSHPSTHEARTFISVVSLPLMVGLARVIYGDSRKADPNELLERDRFANARALEEHLLDAFVPAAYEGQPVRWSAADALHWHRKLAGVLQVLSVRDIAWWQLAGVVRLRTRMIVGGWLGVVGAGALLAFAWQFGVGLGAGFGAGVIVDANIPPRRTPLRLRGRWTTMGRLAACVIVGGLVGIYIAASVRAGQVGSVVTYLGSSDRLAVDSAEGLVLGLAAFAGGIVLSITSVYLGRSRRRSPAGDKTGPRRSVLEAVELTVYGLVTGLLGSITLGPLGGALLVVMFAIAISVVVALETPIDDRTRNGPFEVLKTDRRNALFLLTAFGLAVGLPIGITLGLELGPLWGMLAGWGGGLTIGLGIMLGYTAWGRWLVLGRFWLPLTGRVPWSVVAFLRDAHAVGVLRQTGAVFQFRHVRLQEHLHGIRRPD